MAPPLIAAGPHDSRSRGLDGVGQRTFTGSRAGRRLPILHQLGVERAFDRVGQHLNIGAVTRSPVAKGHDAGAGAVRQGHEGVGQGPLYALQPAFGTVPGVVQAQRLVEHHHDIGPGRECLIQIRRRRSSRIREFTQVLGKVLSLRLGQAAEQGRNQHEQPHQHCQQA